MELKHFFNKSINPLVQKSFACKWSEDNRISVITEKGVHIFEIIFSPTQTNPVLQIIRTFINSPGTLPGEVYKDKIEESILNWEKDDIYSFFMHESYLPVYPKATKMVPEIVDFFWSPQGLLKPQKCMAALITSSGAVELVLQIDREWITAYEFACEWVKHVNEYDELQESSEGLDAKFFKQKLDRLLMTTVTWSPLQHERNEKCFAYLVTGHRNSEIAVWKISDVSSDNLSDILNLNEDIKLDVACKFKNKLINENVKINTLLWIQLDEKNYYIIVGFYNGQIGVLKLNEFEGELKSHFYCTFYSNLDNIPVDALIVLSVTKELVDIVIVKGMYLIFCTLDMFGKMMNMKFICSPDFSITGISKLNESILLITTQYGKIYSVQKGNNQELIFEEAKINAVKNNVQYLGLASSPNKMLFSFITSPCIVYDHLIIREPSDIFFFSTVNVPFLDPVDALYKQQSLSNMWDCLELIKILALKYNDLPKILPKIKMNVESLSLHELRIAFWIMIMCQTVKNKNHLEIQKPHEDIEKSRSYIFLYSAVNHLNRLALQGSLSEIQKLSMSLMRNHLDIWLAGEEEEAETNLSEMVKQALEVTNEFDLIEQENCNLCKSVIIEPWASTCSEGHQLPRCAITCLQVTCSKFRTCTICKEIFHPCLDEEMNEVICPYCDKPALYNNRILNSAFLASRKNLSKKRFVVSNTKESKGNRNNAGKSVTKDKNTVSNNEETKEDEVEKNGALKEDEVKESNAKKVKMEDEDDS